MDSSDSEPDAVNSDAARIFFGPRRTPEARFSRRALKLAFAAHDPADVEHALSTSFPDLISFEQSSQPLLLSSSAPHVPGPTVDDLLEASPSQHVLATLSENTPPLLVLPDIPPQTPKRKRDTAFPPTLHSRSSTRARSQPVDSPKQADPETEAKLLRSLSPQSNSFLSQLLSVPSERPSVIRWQVPTSPFLSLSAATATSLLSQPATQRSPRSPARRVPVAAICGIPSPARRVPVPELVPDERQRPLGLLASKLRQPVARSPAMSIETAPTAIVVAQSSPVKPSLRQPSVLSKIPRASTKPYAPPAKSSSVARSALPRKAAVPESKAPPSTPTKASSVAQSVPAPEPLVFRQVLPGMFKGGSKSSILPSVASPESAPPVQLVFREVVTGSLRNFSVRGSSSSSPPTSDAQLPTSDDPQDMAPSVALSRSTPMVEPPHVPDNTTSDLAADLNPIPLRRGSRKRKSTEHVPELQPPKPLSSGLSRRKVLTSDAIIVSTGTVPVKSQLLSAIPTNPATLKALTGANTARNQEYYSELETLTVRKEGKRPESPSTKVRTVLQKRKESSVKERGNRAERRRRKAEESSGGFDDHDFDTDLDLSMDVPAEKRRRHKRGPGDEEDYETPARPLPGGKGVKWNPSLELVTEPAQPAPVPQPSLPLSKSCLLHVPKLDPLGNVAEAGIPLPNLAKERIVVNRFVYDDDEPAPKAQAKKKA